MDEQLSALLDNELDARACERAVSRVSAEPTLLDAWSRQAMLRAVLSGEDRCMPDAGFADRVMTELAADDEVELQSKVLPFKRRSPARLWATGGLAMAASVAAVAIVVGMLPVQKPGQADTLMLASESPAAMHKVASEAEVQRELEEYLLEHQRLAGRHGLPAPRGYMRMATPGFTQVSYSGE